MTAHARILLVDDDAGLLRTLQVLLEDEGYAVVTAASGEQALASLVRAPVEAVLSDVSMPGMDGLQLLRAVHERQPGLPVLLMTAFASVRAAVEAMKLGAAQYLTKPVDPDELLVLLERTVGESRRGGEHRRLRERAGDPETFDVLAGGGTAMTELRALLPRIAAVDSTVLVRGETGTGKELVARLIHRASRRAPRPFVAVNCTAIPGELVESELFGHEKGAFTGATATRAGRIEEAEGGTLLLDEIGDMPLALQPKLLRFVQERTYRRIGAPADRTADVRLIAATHRDLEQGTAAGTFREDLFHRLATIPVTVPPLRERPEDLPELCEHLVRKIARRLGRAPLPVAADALAALAGYAFPGNVRELENVLERALVLGRAGPCLAADDLLLPSARGATAGPPLPLEGGFARLARWAEEGERDLVRRALAAWPQLPNAEIAERLGTNRRVLELRMKEFGLGKA